MLLDSRRCMDLISAQGGGNGSGFAHVGYEIMLGNESEVVDGQRRRSEHSTYRYRGIYPVRFKDNNKGSIASQGYIDMLHT